MADAPIDFFYTDGTITLTNGSAEVVGQYTGWDAALLPCDFIVPGNGANGMTIVGSVTDATHLQLPQPWSGPTLTNVPYFALRWIKHTDPKIYGVRVSDYLTKLRNVPDDIDGLLQSLNAAIAAMDTDAQAAENAAAAAQQWATQTSAEVAPGQGYGAKKYAQDANGSAGTAQQWATQTGAEVVPGQGYGAKKYAQDAGASAGSAQQWATKTDAEVVAGQGYGARKYAQDASAAATTAIQNAGIIQGLLNWPLDFGNQADPADTTTYDLGIQGT